MAEYHIGGGVFAIYAGTLNKKGNTWLHKSDVTDEAFNAVAQYCVEHNEAMDFDYRGKRYRLEVREIKSESEDSE